MVPIAYSLATPRKLLLPTMPRVCIPRFLALVGRQNVLLWSILQILLELVLMTSPHPFGSLFFKLKGYSGELGTCPSIILCLARFCKGAKLEVRAGTGLICQRCGGITGLNAVAFTGAKAWDI